MPPGLIPDELCNFLGQSYSAPFHYDVDVVVLPAQEAVPDIASDDEGPDPQVAGGPCRISLMSSQLTCAPV